MNKQKYDIIYEEWIAHCETVKDILIDTPPQPQFIAGFNAGQERILSAIESYKRAFDAGSDEGKVAAKREIEALG